MTLFKTSRKIAASPAKIFAAFSDPRRLATWWGPAGFTNTFDMCEFKAGGRWSFVMHGPDGANYPNQNVFEEIDAPRKIVIRHLSEPKFQLTVRLEGSAAGTLLVWEQDF